MLQEQPYVASANQRYSSGEDQGIWLWILFRGEDPIRDPRSPYCLLEPKPAPKSKPAKVERKSRPGGITVQWQDSNMIRLNMRSQTRATTHGCCL